ncbi:LOW QUALITY PROTEIN: spatacsin, partial [Etheostoma spectabile]|uniref:LOW QUALITY PROTEIN: spatacsin n=1 Tax=Etheostoma spectabile TaxID=54343 RepID=UPI0013AF1DE5
MPGSESLEVSVVPENRLCGEVADIRKAELAPGRALLGCLELRGRLVVWDPGDRHAPPAAVDGCYADFCWEEAAVDGGVGGGVGGVGGGGLRLLAVGSEWDLKLLEVEAERSTSISALCVSECPAERLLQTVRRQDDGVCELQSVRVLSFAAGRGCVLLNRDWLLQLRWAQAEAELQTLSCCNIQLTDANRHTAVHHCVCRETLFILCSTGLISVYNICDGRLLASVDLPAYLTSVQAEDDFVSSFPSSSSSSSSSPSSSSLPSSPSFCLLQVSADLSTAVAVTRAHAAVAVDLDHYFSLHTDHLLCAAPPSRPPLRPQHPTDQDSLSSSNCSVAALGSPFGTDRSWEARLASMYRRVQQAAPPSSSSSSSSSSSPSQPAGSSWSSSLPHLRPPQAPSTSRSRVPRGGSSVSFSAPESSAPSLLTVSEFSAQLTFVSPGNRRTTVALWDFESGRVSHHQAEGEAAPVQRCGARQHRLLLKKAGVIQVLFSVSQQDLLSRLMLFGSAATVDAVCHLNSWGRCSIPIHALQAGLKNRQLDTVDFYLKSKENILRPAADQPAASTLTDSFQQLCPALDLLCSSVRESNSEAQSRQFSEQLLNITLSFVNTQVRSVLSPKTCEDPGVRSCVDVLDRYVTELRSYMKRYPWPAGGDPPSTGPADGGPEEAPRDEWEQLPTEEVVRQSVLTNQIARAQAVLRRRGRPEQRLSALRMEGLRQVFSCLQRRDLQTANTLLVNMGFSVKKQLHSICLYTDDRDLRSLWWRQCRHGVTFPKRSCRAWRSSGSWRGWALCRRPAAPLTPDHTAGYRWSVGRQQPVWVRRFWRRWRGRGRPRGTRDSGGPSLDWVRNWDQSCQTAVLLSRLPHTEVTSCDSALLWRYLTALHDQQRVVDWIQSGGGSGVSRWPELTPELVNSNTACSSYLREQILDLLARRGVFVPEELSDLEQLLWRLAQGGGVMSRPPPVPQFRSPLGLDLHSLFISFCLERGLQYLVYTYLEHYRSVWGQE